VSRGYSSDFTRRYKAPTNAPIVVTGSTHQNSTAGEYLYLYDNRLSIFIQESGTRADLGRQGSKIWKSSVLSQDEFSALTILIASKAGDLKDEYQFPGYGGPDGVTYTGDMNTLITIDYQGINRTVRAANYLSAYSNYFKGTYAGMPSPLAELCQKLNEISMNTEEFYRQAMP
jgi:hypothetical protein